MRLICPENYGPAFSKRKNGPAVEAEAFRQQNWPFLCYYSVTCMFVYYNVYRQHFLPGSQSRQLHISVGTNLVTIYSYPKTRIEQYEPHIKKKINVLLLTLLLGRAAAVLNSFLADLGKYPLGEFRGEKPLHKSNGFAKQTLHC